MLTNSVSLLISISSLISAFTSSVNSVMMKISLAVKLEEKHYFLSKRGYPYHFYSVKGQHQKSFYEPNVKSVRRDVDWHILASNDERIKSHNL